MKVVVVGGVAGGASTAARVRRLDASAEITIFEKGQHVSYSNCALPYHLSGVVESEEDLILMFPEDFKANHNIDVHVNHQVIKINRNEKTVTVKNLESNQVFEQPYDKLVLAPGASPIMPESIKGIDGGNVFAIRNVKDISMLKAAIDQREVKDVVVVGGGFIGIEAAENLKRAGKNVTIIEGQDQVLAPYDYDMVQTIHKELDDNGVHLVLGSNLTAIEDGYVRVVDQSGQEMKVPAQVVVMAIGVSPETALAQDACLEIGETKGIKVNDNFQTSDPDIYAVGDAIETVNALTGMVGRVPLAGPAQRQARAAADHICGKEGTGKAKRLIGSSCIKVFELNGAVTGLNEKAAKAAGLKFDSVTLFPNDKVGLMPGSEYLQFKLIFEVPTGKLLGAQAIGKGEADKRVNAIAAMITMGATLEDLKDLELCYAPQFSTAKDVINLAALVGLNVLEGAFKQVHVDQVRSLVERGAYILDVRTPGEYEVGHIKGAHNIPLDEIRERFDEIPRDIPVYVHCRSSQRSYYAICALQGNGFTNVVNISGSFLGISLFEYFDDKMKGREPIVTEYNFE